MINKGILGKEVDGVIEYVYPKTSADMVEYSADQTVEQKIKSIDTNITATNSRISSIVAQSGNDITEIVDARTPVFTPADKSILDSNGACTTLKDRLSSDFSSLSNELNLRVKEIDASMSNIKDNLGIIETKNLVNASNIKNATYDTNTGLLTPTGDAKWFAGVCANCLKDGHKYRIAYRMESALTGDIGIYIIRSGGSGWYAQNINPQSNLTEDDIVITDIEWKYEKDTAAWIIPYKSNNSMYSLPFYISVVDITDKSSSEIAKLDNIIVNSVSSINIENAKHAKTSDYADRAGFADGILDPSVKASLVNFNVKLNYNFDGKFPHVVDSTTNENTYYFRFGLFDKSVDVKNGDTIICMAKFSIDKLELKAGQSQQLEGLKCLMNLRFSDRNEWNYNYSMYDAGEYILCESMTADQDITRDNSNANFLGLNFNKNYNAFNSIITLYDLSIAVLSPEQYKKYGDKMMNAYKSGYTFPMLSLPCIENMQSSGGSSSSTVNTSKTWYTGKKACAYGDSITQQNIYPAVLKQKLGFKEVVNKGVGGRAVYTMATDDAIATIPEDSNVIIMMGGTNDWAQSQDLGTIDDSTTDTFYGSLNIMAQKLTEKFPTALIIFVTTPYGMLHKNTNFSDGGRLNTRKLTTGDYGKCIMDVARKFGFPCADVYGNCGWNKYNITSYIKDDGGLLHTLQNGGIKIGEVICAKLKEVEPSGL